MEYVLIGFAVLIVAAAIACLVLLSQRDAATAKLSEQVTETTDVKNALVDWQDQAHKLEAVITKLKGEIDGLEKDLLTCSDPSAVRTRLRSLLSSGSDSSAGSPVPSRPSGR
jgi:peptidoglycan hydrolase CwlO-like protein